MNSNYVFLCGVMWCRFGQQEAGSELMRAAQGEGPDVSALALAMLEEGCRSRPQFTSELSGHRRTWVAGKLQQCDIIAVGHVTQRQRP